MSEIFNWTNCIAGRALDKLWGIKYLSSGLRKRPAQLGKNTGSLLDYKVHVESQINLIKKVVFTKKNQHFQHSCLICASAFI